MVHSFNNNKKNSLILQSKSGLPIRYSIRYTHARACAHHLLFSSGYWSGGLIDVLFRKAIPCASCNPWHIVGL